MKEEWLFPGAVVPVDVQTTAALVVEIKRLIDVVGGMALKQGPDYERGFIDGMQKQAQSSVDKAVNTMAQPAPVQEPVAWCVTYNGELTGNIFENKRIADLCKRNLEAKYGSGEDRKVVAIYTTTPAQEFVCSTGLCHYKAQRERLVFPTMLRKMWSGGEVQAWLDETLNKEKNT